ncbi:class I SAM-dependent DNA methyltransferase [Agrobacterium vitis]|uniref:class I SAM-dependent DNA methyltransferase n=1 Tax=Agrobacterium vitis TaxID=373 RepID=UPI0012E92B58|nr:class I SAM-dependent methyltransferase [Agrobacterium vitis]
MSSIIADSVIDLYQENAVAWTKLRGRDLVERPWLDIFLSTMLRDGSDIIDIGCGSGEPIARYLIDNGCRVTGVDGAAALIEVAKTNFFDHLWITADMRNLPSLGKFHGLIAWHSLFHLKPEDQRPMFATFSHLALPGAVMLFTSGTTYGEAIGTFEGKPLYHGSLDRAEYEELLHTNGFEVVQYVENDLSCGGATIWLARKRLTKRP